MHADDMRMKQAALAVAITLFRVYVALNNPQLSRTLIATIQSPAFQPFDKFPAPLRVTYMFYLGRMAILDDKLVCRNAGVALCWTASVGRPAHAHVPAFLVMEYLNTCAF